MPLLLRLLLTSVGISQNKYQTVYVHVKQKELRATAAVEELETRLIIFFDENFPPASAKRLHFPWLMSDDFTLSISIVNANGLQSSF